MRVLMLGNSFTFVNNMPDMLANILNAEVVHHTRGGAHLAEQLNPETEMGKRTLEALSKEAWDYVVLQEYSTGPIRNKARFFSSVQTLCGKIRENGAQPLLYATWAFKRGGAKLLESGLDYDSMYRDLYSAYHEAGSRYKVPVADVGKRFYESADPESLFAHDDYHPSKAGSRLAAETIAAVIADLERKKTRYARQPNPKQMPTETDSRLRVLYLYQMLLKYTDESHALTNPQIRKRMLEEHGISMHRTTVPRDIEVLRAAGIEVLSSRTKSLNYYLTDRAFSIPELRILIDAILSSKFITERKSQELIEKLCSMTSETNAAKLRRSVHVTGKAKSDNEKGYYIVDAINEAMNSSRKISFRYFDYNGKKKRQLKNDGKPYTISPYDLLWDGDYYYVVGFCDERNEVRTFRVDRIDSQPEILTAPLTARPKDYRVEKYTQEVFRMFATQEPTTVNLICDNSVMKAIIDNFGKGVRTKALDGSTFRATVKVCTSPTFYRWVFGWDGLIRIEGPEEVKQEYKTILTAELARY